MVSNLFTSGRCLLTSCTDANFYEAQAVVLSNMGQHKQALEIYVFKIRDFAKAEEYAFLSLLVC